MMVLNEASDQMEISAENKLDNKTYSLWILKARRWSERLPTICNQARKQASVYITLYKFAF